LDTEEDIVEWTLPFSLKRTGREIKMVLGDKTTPDSPGHTKMVQALQAALRKALLWNNSILTGEKGSLAEIAKEEQVTQRYIARMIRLAYLDPEIQQAIFSGDVPPDWTVDRFRVAVPLDWAQQRLRFPLRHIAISPQQTRS
jgi:hypothetical protein